MNVLLIICCISVSLSKCAPVMDLRPVQVVPRPSHKDIWAPDTLKGRNMYRRRTDVVFLFGTRYQTWHVTKNIDVLLTFIYLDSCSNSLKSTQSCVLWTKPMVNSPPGRCKSKIHCSRRWLCCRDIKNEGKFQSFLVLWFRVTLLLWTVYS